MPSLNFLKILCKISKSFLKYFFILVLPRNYSPPATLGSGLTTYGPSPQIGRLKKFCLCASTLGDLRKRKLSLLEPFFQYQLSSWANYTYIRAQVLCKQDPPTVAKLHVDCKLVKSDERDPS